MNPETPMTPREETEVRLTALLLGELPPAEAAALEKKMAADLDLQDLHARLRQAVELLRAATALPEQPAPPVPAQLSPERRTRLLAHFKKPAPAPSPVIELPRRDWSWAVPLGLAAALIALLGGTVLLSGFSVKVLKGFVAEPPDFASADGLAAEAAPQSTHWSMQPGATRTYGEAEVRQQSASAGSAAAENLALYAFTPPPAAAPASTWASQPGAIRSSDGTSQAPPAFKLYSSSAMKQTADAPASAPTLSAITISGGATTSTSLATAGRTVLSSGVEVSKSEPAVAGGRERGLAQQADGLARNKVVAGIGSVTAGNLDLSGTLATNAKAELPALATANGKIAAQGLDQTLAFAKAEPAADVALETLDFAKAQTRPTADLDADRFIMLGEARMKARGETAGGDALFYDPSALASRPEEPALNAPAKPALESFLGRKPAENFGTDGEKRQTVKLAEAQNEFGLHGVKAATGEVVSRGAAVEGSDAIALGWLEKNTGLAKNPPGQPTDEKEVMEVRRASPESEAKAKGYQRFENQAGLVSDALSPAPVALSDLEAHGTNGALGIDAKHALSGVRIDYGSPSAANTSGRFNFEPGYQFGDDAAEFGGVVRKDAGKIDGESRRDADAAGFANEDEATKMPAGRIAFWSDDESAKLNVNTASEGVAWDSAARQLAANEGPSYYNKVIGPEFRAKVEQAKQLSKEAEGFYDTGRYDFALKRAEQVLSVDPYNAAARQLKEKIGKAKDDNGVASFNHTRSPAQQPAAPSKPAAAAPPVEIAKLEQPTEKLKKAVKEQAEEEVLARKPAAPAPIPQPEIATKANAFSTFSLNVSDVAFKLAAASLELGKMPDVATVRSEEFINAFDYRDPEPAPGVPLAFVSERARYPFAQNRDLLRFSVKTAAAGRQPGRPLNIVLLLDNSGSMERADRVRIVHEALRVLAAQLQPQDKLSVVTFARTPRLWADGVAGDKAGEVTARVGEITPQGGTDIAAALDLGYATALRHYQPGSINRVVLLTDGAANLGDVNPDALKQKVEAHRKQGVALDCFGIGWEGYDDTLLEALSRNGDGRYGFINTPEEAATGFAAQLAGALRVAASDVKVQVEFNPRRVTAYRQIGYAKHQLTKEQFRDNTVDAAEIGAAESGNALYVCEVNPRGEGDLATVRVRFKVPGTSDYREHEWTVAFTKDAPPLEQASPALRLAGTASAFSEWLTASPYAAEVTPDRLLGLLNGVPAIYGADPRPQKLEWMIRTAKNVSGR